MINEEYEIFGFLMLALARMGIHNSIINHIYDEDGPYFALTKAENYVSKFKKGIY